MDGRKRHLLVDSLGLILAVVVHRANIQDRDGAKLLLEKARWFAWLQVIWADAGYGGKLIEWVRAMCLGRCAQLKIVQKVQNNGFAVLPHRWFIERTHARLTRYRRLARDYEVKTQHSEAFTYIAACAIMPKNLVLAPILYDVGATKLLVSNSQFRRPQQRRKAATEPLMPTHRKSSAAFTKKMNIFAANARS